LERVTSTLEIATMKLRSDGLHLTPEHLGLAPGPSLGAVQAAARRAHEPYLASHGLAQPHEPVRATDRQPVMALVAAWIRRHYS
jgi:hypothetical protein